MQFLGMFRHVRTAHAQGLTKEMFVSLGQNAVSARDVFAQGGLIVMAEGEMRNRNYLTRALKLTYDASMALITARAYRMWGADYPRHIEGAVVTAVIDRTEDRMIVSADRAGAIGVYYAWRGRSAAFASHPALLLKMGAAGRKIDREGINELFALGGFFTPGRTAFKDIRMLEGGCVLVADTRGMRVKRYYSAVTESLAKEETSFSLEEYVEALPHMEYALFLENGLSRALAESIKGKRHTVYYHVQGVYKADDDLEQWSVRMKEPVEQVRFSDGCVNEALKDVVMHTGFPGTGMGESVVYSIMKEAFCLFPAAIVGGGGVFMKENMRDGNLLRFLKKEVNRKTDPQGYLRDRFNELTDKWNIPFDASGGEEWAERVLCALMGAPQFALRLRLLAGAAGGEIRTPLMDERFVRQMLKSIQTEENTHFPRKQHAEKCVLQICDEAKEMAQSEDQPIFEVVSAGEIKREIQSRHADISALSRLIQINLFLYQYDAELSLC